MAYPALPTYDTQKVFLTDYITVEQAAGILERTASRVRQMILNNNFATIMEVGDRPLYLLDRAEVEGLAHHLQNRTAKKSL